MRTLLFSFLLFSTTAWSADPSAVHRKAVVVDTHNDVLQRALSGEDLAIRTKEGHSDIVRMREGGVDVEFFSVWCGSDYGTGTAFRRANQQIDSLESMLKRCPSLAAAAKDMKTLKKNLAAGKLAALIGVEGGHMIEDSLSYLDALAARGMKYLTLTWNNSTTWATSAADETERGDSLAFKGLTEFGKRVVRRLNELGVMVDLSHVGVRTFWDALAVTKKPVLVSHSSVYAICPSRRNLMDDQIKAVAKNGGVICVNFYSGFIDSTFHKRMDAIKEEHRALADSVHTAISDRWKADGVIDSLLAPFYNRARPPLSLLVDHIDYIAKMAGVDHVGIGSDFDGVESVPEGMDDVTFLPNITKELMRRGYSAKAVEKILGGNVLRVMAANEKH